MINVRRWYIFIILTVSLQAVTWALVNLIYRLINTDLVTLEIATPIAVLVVGLPVFLGHWIWANRLAGASAEERGSTLRRFFLYGNLAVFLLHLARQSVYLLYYPLDLFHDLLTGKMELTSEWLVSDIAVLLIMAGLCYYFYSVIRRDERSVPVTGGTANIRRLFVLFFSGYGLSVMVMASTYLLRFLFGILGGRFNASKDIGHGLIYNADWLIMGVVVWVIFWRIAQRLFTGPDPEERNANLRKLYQYLAVFAGTLTVVTYSAMILTGILKRLLQAPSGGGDVFYILPIILTMGVVWLFHALVLKDDIQLSAEAPRQANIRRWYLYLVAAVGLSSTLTGVTGDISVVLRSLGNNLGLGFRAEFAAYTAAIIAGVLVWLIPWREAQDEISQMSPIGSDARRSPARKFYLYFFLLAATLAVLGSAVYIVASIVRVILGEACPTINELGFAISTSLIGAGLWLYHGSLLRGDSRSLASEKAKTLKTWKVVILDAGESRFGQMLVDQLRRELPDLVIDFFGLKKPLARKAQADLVAHIKQAGLIAGPWSIAVTGATGGIITPGITEAVVTSPAEKLLIPLGGDGWHWMGLARNRSQEFLVRQMVREIKQMLGKETE